MHFIKNIELQYSQVLKNTLSWKIDFTELTNYTVKGDATRSFDCHMNVITSEEHKSSPELKELIRTLERLCFGWLSFHVTWHLIKNFKVFP